MAFKDRFKDKMSIVGKDGENAMLSPAAVPPPQPKKAPSPSLAHATNGKLKADRAAVPIAAGVPSPLVSPQIGVAQTQSSASFAPPLALPQPSVPPQAMFVVPNYSNQQRPQQLMGGAPSAGGPPASFQLPLKNAVPQFQSLGMGQAQLPLLPSVAPQPPHSSLPQSMGLLPQSQQQFQQQFFQQQQQQQQFVFQQGNVMNGLPFQGAAPRAQNVPLAFQPTGMMPSSGSYGGVGAYDYNSALQNKESSPHGDKKSNVKYGRRAGSTEPKDNNGGRRITGSKDDNGALVGRRASSKNSGHHDARNDVEEQRPNTDPTVSTKREISYKPYSVEDYRKMKEEVSKIKAGGLGPADTDEQRAAAAKLQRQREYAENIKKINRAILAPVTEAELEALGEEAPTSSPRQARPIVQPPPAEVVEKQQRREKAIEYSKGVPKPKPKPVKADEEIHDAHDGESTLEMDADGQTKREKEQKLMDLEAKHARDQLMVENIKKQLKI